MRTRLLSGIACCLVAIHGCLPAYASDAVHQKQTAPAALKTLQGQADPTIPARYPALDAMEAKAFGRAFPDDLLEVRLARLEFKIYGKTAPALTLNERTDRLRASTGDRTLERELFRPIKPSSRPAATAESEEPVLHGEWPLPLSQVPDYRQPILTVPFTGANSPVVQELHGTGAAGSPAGIQGLHGPGAAGTGLFGVPGGLTLEQDLEPPSRMALLKQQAKPLAIKLARRAARQAARRAMRQFLPAGMLTGMSYVGPAMSVASVLMLAAKSKAFNPP